MIRMTIVAAAALLASTSAHAATLSISNGFLKNVLTTTSGYSFDMGDSGTLFTGSTTVSTSLAVSCTLDTSDDDLDCAGTMKVGSVSTPISIRFYGASGAAIVAVPASTSANHRAAARTWHKQFIEPAWLPGVDDDDTDTGGGGGGGTCDPPTINPEWIFTVKKYKTSYCSDVTYILDGVEVSALWW